MWCELFLLCCVVTGCCGQCYFCSTVLPACDGIFPGSSHTSDLQIGTPVAALPGAWCYRVSAGTGQPGVNIL